jgi:nucleotide-binding universal stress UspA family protein
MYQRILIPLENSETDRTILEHIKPLARMCGSRLTLVHVADGWVARNFETLDLQESDEMREDRKYLAAVEAELKADGFDVSSVLAMGEPPKGIIRLAAELKADLIAMATHGHKLIGDIIYGTTADKVRHQVEVPVLLLKAPKPAPPPAG